MTSWKSSLAREKAYRILVILGLVVILAGLLAVPFWYETQTLWYKVGADKAILRAGQMAGLLTLVLLILQIILTLKGRLLEGLFGAAQMIRRHRLSGVFIACAACCHVVLVLGPEGLNNLPVGKKYWPEMTGGAAFFLSLVTVVLSRFRSLLRLDYGRWRTVHLPLGYSVPVLVLIHVLFVSESFQQGAPRGILLIVYLGLAVFVAVVKTGRWKSRS
jgi:predicted ferric reductase